MESLSRMLLVPLMLMGPVSCLDDDVMGIDAGPPGIDTSPEDSGGGDTDSDDRDTGEPRYSRCYEAGESPEGKAFACDWMTVEGATYMMGSPEGMAQEEPREYPQHPVAVPTFRMWRTENTVAQYLACVDEGGCTPIAIDGCNDDFPEERGDHPINCTDWFQARDFCAWLGGRLPSEAEWEFAARDRGQDVLYPWGDEDPTCELAVIDMGFLDPTKGTAGCDGIYSTQAVCSKPLGNTTEGLCDMVGNVYEWVEDWFHEAYEYVDGDGVLQVAPADGSAWLDPPNPWDFRVMKGGGIGSPEVNRPTCRQFHDGTWSYGGLGVRCAQDL
jgi:formylglycine-generating enzyme required for sulfatase activity